MKFRIFIAIFLGLNLAFGSDFEGNLSDSGSNLDQFPARNLRNFNGRNLPPRKVPIPTHSMRTLIVSLAGNLGESGVKKLADDHNMSILYIYRNFNMCALSAKRDLSEAELKNLKENLERDERVLGVNYDRIMELHHHEIRENAL